MKFSVIVPVYNGERFIANAIKAVLGQTYTDWELIIINDGSTDDTEEVIKSYIRNNRDVNIRLISQVNKGLGAARNTGIKSSSGEYIALLDADDIWYERKLEAVYNVLIKMKNIDVICHDEYLVRRDTDFKRRLCYGPREACSYCNLLFKRNVLSGSAAVIKKEKLFEVGLFSEDRKWHGVEDYDMWLKLARIGAEFFFLNEVYGEYVMHDSNMTLDMVSFNLRALDVIEHHFRQWPNKSLFQRYLFKRRKAKIHQGTAAQLLKEGKFCLACKYIEKSLIV